MRKRFTAAIFAIGCLMPFQSASAKVSLRTSLGYYKMPSELFNLGDANLTKTPPHLEGVLYSATAMADVNRRWSAGLQLFKVEAVGHGVWERSDTPEILARNNVTGEATGRTNLDVKGLVLIAERRFLREPVCPYVQFGGGIGRLTAQFSGEFRGEKKFGPFSFPFTEPANDKVEKTIPIVMVEAGLRLYPMKHLQFDMGGYWNTGYGAKVGVGTQF